MSSDWQRKAELYEAISELQELGTPFICDGMLGLNSTRTNIPPATTKQLYEFFEHRNCVIPYGTYSTIAPKIFGLGGGDVINNFIKWHKNH